MRKKEKIQFVRRLSFLVRAGIPLEGCISTLAGQAQGRKNKKFFEILLGEIRAGSTLSLALAVSSKNFRGSAESLVKIGEESGTLSESLANLAIFLEKAAAVRSKILQALIYPAVIATGTIALTVFLILYIFPKIIPVFISLKIQLPISTRILIAVSDFARANLFWILGSLAVSMAGLFVLFKLKPWFRRAISATLLKFPFVGRLIQSYILARSASLLATLLASGVKVDEAVTLISESINYPIYKKFFIEAAENVHRGGELSRLCASRKDLFPALFSNMLAVGEMSGSFSDVLKDLACAYESELENSAKNLTQMIEPALMIFMSLLVGVVAISIITPLYNITSTLGR